MLSDDLYSAWQLILSPCEHAEVSSSYSCYYKITPWIPMGLESFNKLASVTAAQHFITSFVHTDKIRWGLQTFNCFVKTTATYRFFFFFKSTHWTSLGKVNLFKISKPLFLFLHTHIWHFNYAVLSDRCGDIAHVKVRASSLLIFYYIFLYFDCQWESDRTHHWLKITQDCEERHYLKL